MIENPLYDEFLQFASSTHDFFYAVTAGLETRERLCKKYSWSIPSDKIGTAILQYTDKVVEIGAGTGYWAWFLSQYGIDVKAYDAALRNWDKPERRYCTVEKGGVSKAGRYPDRALLLCWPPYSSSMAYWALKAYKGDLLIYIGEGEGGCTGDDRFHELLNQEWEPVYENLSPNWAGINSEETIWKRL